MNQSSPFSAACRIVVLSLHLLLVAFVARSSADDIMHYASGSRTFWVDELVVRGR